MPYPSSMTTPYPAQVKARDELGAINPANLVGAIGAQEETWVEIASLGSLPTWQCAARCFFTFPAYATGTWAKLRLSAKARRSPSPVPRIRVRVSSVEAWTAAPSNYAYLDAVLEPGSQSSWSSTTIPTYLGRALSWWTRWPTDQWSLFMIACYASAQAGGDYAAVELNDVHVEIEATYPPPVTTVVAPIGPISGSSPFVQWSYASAAGLAQGQYRVKIFAEASYTAPGFNPATSAARYDSGDRDGAGLTFAVPVQLSPGAYRAYVRTTQYFADHGGFHNPNQPGLWSYSTFTVVAALPPIKPPTIPTNVVAALSDVERQHLRGPHRPTFQVVLFSWDGTASWPLNVIDGTVVLDRRSQVRASASLTVSDIDLVPGTRSAIPFNRPLHCYGSYLHVARGVGDTLVSIATLRINRVEVRRALGGHEAVAIEASDFVSYLSDARMTWSVTRQVSGGPYSVTAVVDDLLSEAGLANGRVSSGAGQVVRNYVNARTDDRAEALKDLCDGAGWTFYARHDGVIHVGTEPDPNGEFVYSFTEGTDAIVLSTTTRFTRDRLYDLALAYNPEGGVVGIAYDGNPDSPVVRSGAAINQPRAGAGPFSPGGVPVFFASPMVVTLDQAKTAAANLLRRSALPAEEIVFEAVPTPDLRPADPIEVVRSTGLADRYIVDTISLPLSVEAPMRVSATGPLPDIQPVTP